MKTNLNEIFNGCKTKFDFLAAIHDCTPREFIDVVQTYYYNGWISDCFPPSILCHLLKQEDIDNLPADYAVKRAYKNRQTLPHTCKRLPRQNTKCICVNSLCHDINIQN